MLYVSYGSNLNVDQMTYRVPGAKPYGNGFIHNWKLDFKGVDGSAYATITQSQGSKVPVVLWEMSDKDEETMDRYEGYPNAYYKKKIAVYIGDQKKFGTVYIMNDTRRVARPSRRYVNTVRNGYIYFGLDESYLTDALARNSVDFYQDDLVEVREFKKFSTSVSKNVSKKKSGKKAKKKNKYLDQSIWKEPNSGVAYGACLTDYGKRISRGTVYSYPVDPYLDPYGSRRPSLSEYDGDYD